MIPPCSYSRRKEIYPGSKLRHFKELHKKTGIPYEEMASREVDVVKLEQALTVENPHLALLRR